MFCSCLRAHGGACWWDIRPVLEPMVGHAGGILGVLFLF